MNTGLVKTFCIPSKSQPNGAHYVSVWVDGFVACDCKAWEFRRNCSHKKEINKYYGN